MTVRLNLGAGEKPMPGYENLDIQTGTDVTKLNVADGSVDEIRASHVLEHIPYERGLEVVRGWVKALKPGGVLKVAVPDFDKIAEAYQQGAPWPIEGYVMGGHTNKYDVHLAIFNRRKLRDMFRACGLVRMETWQNPPEWQDCASLPVSLNLQGVKPSTARPTNITVCMSVPRLGFMDNFFTAFEAFYPLKIKIRKQTGAFWGQCLERALQEEQDSNELLLTMDYDSVFTSEHVMDLIELMHGYPEADVIAPLQVGRAGGAPLATWEDADGKIVPEITRQMLEPELVPIATAHFGLTIIRPSTLRALPHPWFLGQPNSAGEWGAGRVDDDIYFWKLLKKHGGRAFLAPRVAIGHLELNIRWPDINFGVLRQDLTDWQKDRKPPEDVWV